LYYWIRTKEALGPPPTHGQAKQFVQDSDTQWRHQTSRKTLDGGIPSF